MRIRLITSPINLDRLLGTVIRMARSDIQGHTPGMAMRDVSGQSQF